MKYSKWIVILICLAICLGVAPKITWAQGGVQQQPLELPPDPQLENEAKHNLEVAKFSLRRKAYKGATDRLLEIIFVYPKFSRFDEVLDLLADSYLKDDNKTEAAKYYTRLVKEFPDSRYAKDAKKHLVNLPVPEASGDSAKLP